MNILSSYSIKDLYPPRTICYIDENDKVADAIKVLTFILNPFKLIYIL